MTREFPTTSVPPASEGDINYSLDLQLQHFTGATLVVGDTVFLSDDGVEVLASTDGSYYAVNAYSFRDADAEEIGGMYARDDSGQNVVGFRVVDEADNDDDTVLEIESRSTTSATASVVISAARGDGAADTYIQLENDGSGEIDLIAPAAGHVRIGEKLNLLGA